MKYELITVRLDQLLPNPFRGYATSKLSSEKVATLRRSIRETGGLWPNIVARPVDRRRVRFEVCHGHHRLAAARKELGQAGRVQVSVAKIDDGLMIKMLIEENEPKFSGSTLNLLEHVTIVVKAFAHGDIKLKKLFSKQQAAHPNWRVAPGFQKVGSSLSGRGVDYYSAETLKDWLGANWSLKRARILLGFLELEELGWANRDHLVIDDGQVMKCDELEGHVAFLRQSHEKKEAKARAKEYSSERKKGSGKKAAKKAAKKQATKKKKAEQPASKPEIESFASKVITDLERLTMASNKIQVGLAALIHEREYLSMRKRNQLQKQLNRVADHFIELGHRCVAPVSKRDEQGRLGGSGLKLLRG